MFRERLDRLADRVEGVLVASVVGRDGLVVQAVARGAHPDLELLAAEIPERIRVLERQVPELGTRSLRQLSLTSDQYTILLSSMSENYLMMLVLQASGSLGRARYEMRRAAVEFHDDLD